MKEKISDRVDVREVKLEKLKLMLLQKMSEEFAEGADIDFEYFCDWTTNDIMMRVVQIVWGQRLKRIEIQYPANWWQHFKKRWFPEWAKKRWTVVYEKTRVNVYAIYPDIAFPRERHNIIPYQLIEGAANISLEYESPIDSKECYGGQFRTGETHL